MSRYLTADRIHDGIRFTDTGSILQVSEDGTIEALLAPGTVAASEHYAGTLCPGFINAHCHTELSHMQGVIPEGTGLPGFLTRVMQHRNLGSPEEKEQSRWQAFRSMQRNGIVAIGDIANTTDTLDLRGEPGMYWYTFVESIGFTPERAPQSFAYAENTYQAFAAQEAAGNRLQQSIVPHAPYSVSEALFRLIGAHGSGKTLSVHNQETADEALFYQDKSGAFPAFLEGLGIPHADFQPSGRNSLQTYMHWLGTTRPTMLVHNTFSSGEDMTAARAHFPQLFWCLCPNANLYIEQRLPDIPQMLEAGLQLCIGTDSLASNHQLSVLAELESIDRQFPEIGWEQLFSWACHNGAKALQLENELGTFRTGTKPGIVWIGPDKSMQRLDGSN
ncbi:MAG: amidohydrolase family protein [Chitinophagaceae bacterium]